MGTDQRLNPDELLKVINLENEKLSSGWLRVFLGMSAGVGKTYAMLKAAHQKQKEGLQVWVGVVETHGRSETAELLNGLHLMPRKKINYRETDLEEFDIDAVLAKKPDLVLIDELAHSNAPGSRHTKRYQDVLEILEAGIDVYTTLNVQHLESRKDSVENITGIKIRETVPDSILERAHLVELVDIAPSELLKRLSEGKVYLGDKAKIAADHFFQEDKLTALREIALRMTAERVDQDLQRFAVTRDEKPWQTNERLLVAVSHSPYSEKIIRATRRLAYNLEAPWIALHVDTGITLSDLDQSQLQRNLNLARDLKAEVVNTTDSDIASAIQRISRQKNVTQVVVGRPNRSWLRNMLEGGSLLQRLVKESQEVDVHIIRNDMNLDLQPSLRKDLALYRTYSGWMKYYYIAWFFLAVTILGSVLEPYIGYRAVGFIFLLAVVLTSLWGSMGAVLVSAALSAFIWNFGFIPPRFTFVVSSADDAILLLANFVVALITGILTNRVRIRENLIRQREEKTNLLNLVLQDISQSQNKSEFITKVSQRVSHYFDGYASVMLKARTGELIFDQNKLYLDEKEKAVALWSYQNQKNAGWSTETLGQANYLYIPLRGVSESVGLFVFQMRKSQKNLSVDQKELLMSITTQLGISIERHFLSRRLVEAQRLKDSELLHQTLLNSISHEMRTPLTTIMGVSAALEQNKNLDPSAQNLTASLFQASDRLNRVIENLLDMSRLNSGVLGLKLEWHDFSDLVGVVLKKLEKNLLGHTVQVKLSDDIDLIYIDFRLFEHALSNLIFNATQYGGSNLNIHITAEKIDSVIRIQVCDNGVGIAPEYRKNLFEKFYRVPGSPAGGTGLGLSIVKGIIQLHKGEISYKENIPRGARFVIEMPYLKSPSASRGIIEDMNE